ncbi:MAG: protein-tyrosine-phosphatase [Crocinitomicaceae bacterium]|nr:protein-tyrosine-phosphatase [Crocinitomicaceae bacterium]|tara:strand:+ start:56925 stop:57383 length:459 start_codon:yes stop_codon:yes gene_type:complete
MKILMVCLGNICRSPLAHGILREKIKLNNINASVDSAGTSNYHIGDPPDFRMITTAKLNNIMIEDLKARQFTTKDFYDFDIIYVMDKNNYDNVIQLAKNKEQKEKVKMILNEITQGMNHNVPDPYYGGNKGFEEVFNMLDQATDKIIKNLLK